MDIDRRAAAINPGAGRQVVSPAVPRAGDDGSVHGSLAQRTAHVETVVVHRVETRPGVEDGDGVPVNIGAGGPAGREVLRRRKAEPGV
jgi:hypothetical protein